MSADYRRAYLEVGAALSCAGASDDTIIICIDAACAHFAKGLEIRVTDPGEHFVSALKTGLLGHINGHSPVWVKIQQKDTQISYRLGDEWRINISLELLHSLGEIQGVEKVTALYGN